MPPRYEDIAEWSKHLELDWTDHPSDLQPQQIGGQPTCFLVFVICIELPQEGHSCISVAFTYNVSSDSSSSHFLEFSLISPTPQCHSSHVGSLLNATEHNTYIQLDVANPIFHTQVVVTIQNIQSLVSVLNQKIRFRSFTLCPLEERWSLKNAVKPLWVQANVQIYWFKIYSAFFGGLLINL